MSLEENMLSKNDNGNYSRTRMQKDIILQRLREKGCRITKQRQMLLDIILEEDCSCCKEIYYRAAKLDSSIGTATVYRMINTLEEIGAISRKNMYKIACDEKCGNTNCHNTAILLEDGRRLEMSSAMLNHVIRKGLETCGYTDGTGVSCVISNPCDTSACTIA